MHQSNRRQFISRAGAGLAAFAVQQLPVRAAEADESRSYGLPRCRVIPLAGHQASFRVDGREWVRWHFGRQYPRPFFFPFSGPSGTSLTRMGHPGAPNHDHHRSVWFAHYDVGGIDFWSDGSEARIRQKRWLCYQESDDEAVMAVSLGWYGGGDSGELMEQELIAVSRPGGQGENFLELHSTFRPISDPVHLGKTNFGFLAVRVAKSISAYFGGGRLRDSEGREGEPEIFGKRAKWMDYSGPVGGNKIEGITYYDHSGNPRHPTHWHVREDGWMGASLCMQEGLVITKDEPLKLRYLLHSHRGDVDRKRAEAVMEEFSKRASYDVVRSERKHRQFDIQRGRSEDAQGPVGR